MSCVVWVDNEPQARAACAELKQARMVAFDMEGCRGQTSLIQLALSEEKVYVFDVLKLGATLFDASLLLPILTDPSLVKLCFDCRCDLEALYQRHGVRAFGFYDLQIVYTTLFQKKGDPFLKGLGKVLQAPGLSSPGVIEQKKMAKRVWARSDFEAVMERPLPPQVLDYCAADVIHLFRMHQLWSPHLQQQAVVQWTQQRAQSYLRRRAEWCMARLDFPIGSVVVVRGRGEGVR